ncbi:unnamed protein product, partial [Adineta steineri]
ENVANGSLVYNLRRHLAIQHSIELGINTSSYRREKHGSQQIPPINTAHRAEIDKYPIKPYDKNALVNDDNGDEYIVIDDDVEEEKVGRC